MQSDFERQSLIRSSELEDFSHCCRELLSSSHGRPSLPSLHDIFSSLLTGIRQYLPFDHLGFGVFNLSTNMVDVILRSSEIRMPMQIPLAPDSLGVLLKGHRAIEVANTDIEAGFADLCALARPPGLRSFRVVPLFRGNCQAIGVMAALRREPGNFSSEESRYMDHAAQLISLALENAVVTHVLGRETLRLETLSEVNAALVSGVDITERFKEVSGLIRRVVNHEYTHLALYEKNQNAMKLCALEAGNDLPLVLPEALVIVSECPAGISYQRGETLQFSHDDLVLIDSEYTRNLLRSGIRSVSCFPLTSHGRKLGALALASVRDRRPNKGDVGLLTQIAAQVAMAIDNARAYDEIAGLRNRLAKEKLCFKDVGPHRDFGEVVGNSRALCEVLRRVEIAAPTEATVLVLGETGTGKELVARALHRLSSRHDGNFVKLNCAAIPTGLLESELFGHEKGAFTGAISQKVGRIELADKGTLFLDEIGEVPMELQPKLLRFLQDQEFERLGGVRTIRVNVRVIAATNRDLEEATAQHQFRRDLYYRLHVFPIDLPPLRSRTGDIPLLVRYFVQKFSRQMGKTIESVPVATIQELEQWHWPGNIRELENFIERSVILSEGPVLFAPTSELRASRADGNGEGVTLEEFEREYIVRTLRVSRGIIAGTRGAAARMGMKRTTLQSRIHKLGITREEYET